MHSQVTILNETDESEMLVTQRGSEKFLYTRNVSSITLAVEQKTLIIRCQHSALHQEITKHGTAVASSLLRIISFVLEFEL